MTIRSLWETKKRLAISKKTIEQKNQLIVKQKEEVFDLKKYILELGGKIDISINDAKLSREDSKMAREEAKLANTEAKLANKKLTRIEKNIGSLLVHKAQTEDIPYSKQHCVTILKVINEKYIFYHVVRVQRCSLAKSIKDVEKEHGKANVQILINLNYYPNAVGFWVQFKNKFSKIVQNIGTNCTIKVSEELFVALIEYYASIRTKPEATELDAKTIINHVRSTLPYDDSDDSDDSNSDDSESNSDSNN